MKSTIAFRVIDEIVSTERSYVESLCVAGTTFGTTFNDVSPLFAELARICAMQKRLLNLLRVAWTAPDTNVWLKSEKVAMLLEAAAPQLRSYRTYTMLYEKCAAALRSKLKKRKYCRRMKKVQSLLQSVGASSMLDSYLIQPVQRQPRYLLLVNEVLKQLDKMPAPEGEQHQLFVRVRTAFERALVSITDAVNFVDGNTPTATKIQPKRSEGTTCPGEDGFAGERPSDTTNDSYGTAGESSSAKSVPAGEPTPLNTEDIERYSRRKGEQVSSMEQDERVLCTHSQTEGIPKVENKGKSQAFLTALKFFQSIEQS